MTKKAKATDHSVQSAQEETVDIAAELSVAATYKKFTIWLVGDTPLIVHAWSEKAKREMLQKQVKATKSGKEARKPEEDFLNSLYEMGTDENNKTLYGFPVTAFKSAILSVAHKDKGVPRSTVQSALWLEADMVRVRPALAGAICDMPLVRIFGSEPEMREDMVRIGTGMTKTANLAYRGQFTNWAVRLSGKFNATVLSSSALAFLIAEAGLSIGVGEWRNTKSGIFGAFHVANVSEQDMWEKFASGKGMLPVRDDVQYAEAAE